MKERANSDKVNMSLLARLKVYTENSEAVSILKLLDGGPVVFIFLRHFSCIACRSLVKTIWARKEQFQESKVRIVFIGNGSPSFIKEFKRDLSLQGADIYTDPTLKTFDACGLKRSVLHLMNPKSIKTYFELSRQGHSQGKWDGRSGTHTQMGGVVAFSQLGKVVYHFISDYLGGEENLNFSELVA